MTLPARLYLTLGIVCAAAYALLYVFLPIEENRLALFLAATFAVVLLILVILVRSLLQRLNIENQQVQQALAESQAQVIVLQAQFAEVTTRDELTGCANERHLMELLIQHRAMFDRGDYQFTVVMSQVDQFSDIVAELGLGAGNDVLKVFASIVKAALREVDIIARLRADKFIFVLSGAGEEASLSIINRISSLIAQIQVTGSDKIKITASSGITTYHGAETSEELLSHAEQALEFAVAEGRDRVAGYNYEPPVLDGGEMDGGEMDAVDPST
jgi:diguanylate cyclase (GGDEF)-like protein